MGIGYFDHIVVNDLVVVAKFLGVKCAQIQDNIPLLDFAGDQHVVKDGLQ